MKKKTGKMILLTGVLCILSLAVCACGKTEEASDTQEPQVVQGEPVPEDDTEDDASAPEPDAEGIDTGNEPESPEASPEPQSGESSSQGTDRAVTVQTANTAHRYPPNNCRKTLIFSRPTGSTSLS